MSDVPKVKGKELPPCSVLDCSSKAVFYGELRDTSYGYVCDEHRVKLAVPRKDSLAREIIILASV